MEKKGEKKGVFTVIGALRLHYIVHSLTLLKKRKKKKERKEKKRKGRGKANVL